MRESGHEATAARRGRRFDGKWNFATEDLACTDGHVDDEPDLYWVVKKAAGALLDGREWKEFPVEHR